MFYTRKRLASKLHYLEIEGEKTELTLSFLKRKLVAKQIFYYLEIV